MYPVKQLTTLTVPFFLHDVNGDGVTDKVDGDFTKRISKNGGAFAAMTVTITGMENGWYSLPLDTGHTDTNGILTVSISHASAKRVNLQWRVGTHIASDSTPQTGDSFARIGATGSALTSLATQASVDTIQADTNDIQTRIPTNSELLLETTIATLTTQTDFTLADGSPDDSAYFGHEMIITDAVTSTQKAVVICTGYTASTKQVTSTVVTAPAGFVKAVGDKVQIRAFTSLRPITHARTITVASNGSVNADMVAVSGNSAAADNFETMLDGTGTKDLTLRRLIVANTVADSAAVSITSTNAIGLDVQAGGTFNAGIRCIGSGFGPGLAAAGGVDGHGIDALGGETGTTHGMNLSRGGAGTGDDLKFANADCTIPAISASGILDILKAVSGTADAGGSTTTIVDAERTEADTDYWKGSYVAITSGACIGQVRQISGFNATTDTITVSRAFTQSIATGVTYIILRSAGGADGVIDGISAAVLALINAEVVDTLGTDALPAFAQGAPSPTPTIKQVLVLLNAMIRNKQTQSASQYSLYEDNGTTLAMKQAVSESAGTLTRDELETGP